MGWGSGGWCGARRDRRHPHGHVGPAPASTAPPSSPAAPGVDCGDLTRRGAERRARGGLGDSGGAGQDSERGRVGATMASVDLEKLRTTGAGKAIGVLTSGGDAQGGRGRAAGRWRAGVLLSPGPCGVPATLGPDLRRAVGRSSRPRSPSLSWILPGAPGTRVRAAHHGICAPPACPRPRGRVCAAGCGRRPGALPALSAPGGPGTPSRSRVLEALFPGMYAERRPPRAGQSPQAWRTSLFLVLKHDPRAQRFPQTPPSGRVWGISLVQACPQRRVSKTMVFLGDCPASRSQDLAEPGYCPSWGPVLAAPSWHPGPVLTTALQDQWLGMASVTPVGLGHMATPHTLNPGRDFK